MTAESIRENLVHRLRGLDGARSMLFSLIMIDRLLALAESERRAPELTGARAISDRCWTTLLDGRLPSADDGQAGRSWIEENGPHLDSPYITYYARELFSALHSALGGLPDGASVAEYVSGACLDVPSSLARREDRHADLSARMNSPRYLAELTVHEVVLGRLEGLVGPISSQSAVARDWSHEFPLPKQ